MNMWSGGGSFVVDEFRKSIFKERGKISFYVQKHCQPREQVGGDKSLGLVRKALL